MKVEELPQVINILKKHYGNWNVPVKDLATRRGKDPFKILICALLSTRTRDEITAKVCDKLFQRISKPEDILNIPLDELERTLYPVGFYRNKAKQLKLLCLKLLKDFDGNVPSHFEGLISLPGVGRKVANLVLSEGFNIPTLCVDTHVHRITNRWCLIDTKTPQETEKQLKELVPKRYWRQINKLLVALGQKICTPRKPKCFDCPIENFCGKCGVSSAGLLSQSPLA